MNTSSLLRALKNDLSLTPVHRVGSEFFVPLPKPRALASLINEIPDSSDEFEEFAELPGSSLGDALQLLEKIGLSRSLLTFNWLSFGPMSSSAGLSLVGEGDGAWLVFWDEWSNLQAIAAISRADDPLVVSAAVSAHISNAPEFKHEVQFGSLPGTTFNRSPELVSEVTVRAAYLAHLNNEKRAFTNWREFLNSYIEQQTQPDHLKRCLSLLKQAASVVASDNPDAVQDLLYGGETQPPRADVREAVFESWWREAYRGATSASR
jgi:hypothetical protein